MNTRHSSPQSGRQRAARAFTLIELLVAAAITVVLAGLMIALVGSVLTGWNRSHGTLTAEAQARITLDQLAQDLSGALYRNDGGAWLAATVLSDTGTSGLWETAANAKPATVSVEASVALADARFGVAGVWLRLITAAPTITRDSSEPGAPVAVAYQLIRRRVGAATSIDEMPHYVLHRSEIAPAATFAGGYNLNPTAKASPLPQPASYLETLKQPAVTTAIADNVVDFGVRLYAREDSGGLTLLYPIAANAGDDYFAEAPSGASASTKRFPDVVDVLVRVLTDEGVRQIQLLERGKRPGDWWKIAEANSRVFTRRIELHPGPF